MQIHAVGLRRGTGGELSTNISNFSVNTCGVGFARLPSSSPSPLSTRSSTPVSVTSSRQESSSHQNSSQLLRFSQRYRQSSESTSSSSRWGQVQGYSQVSFRFCLVTGQIAVVEATEFAAAAALLPGVFRLIG